MNINKAFLSFILFFYYSVSSFSSDFKVITGGYLINSDGSNHIENSVIIIKGDKIVDVGTIKSLDIPKDAEIIDAKGKFIIPGLIDSHIHFFQSGGLYTRPDGLDLTHRVPYKEEIKWIKDNIDDVFRRYLRCGITSVVDVGGPMWNFDVRELARKSEMAPNIFITGPLISSYQPDAFKIEDAPIIRVNSKAEALELLRKQIEKKPDFIKIWYIIGKGMDSEYFYKIVKAVIDESHKNRLPVYVHATELSTAKKALKAGCDVLVHSVKDQEIDDEFLELAKENNITYIPTLWVFESYNSVYGKKLKLLKTEHLLGNPYVIGTLFDMYELSDSELGDRQRKLLKENKPVETSQTVLDNLKTVHENGINVAVGTDAGNVGVLHGPSIFHEFALMSKAGLTNMEIIQYATINPAKMLRKDNKLGSIEKGKLADIVILNSNPLDDIQNTSDIYKVIKSGKIFDPGQLISPSPEDLAQVQLNAYNARDIEAFLAVYSDDVKVYTFPDKLIYEGKEIMRERYSKYFEKAVNLHCGIVNRITFGNYVIDREFVTTGIPGRNNINAVAIYEVKDGLIRKVWFLPQE